MLKKGQNQKMGLVEGDRVDNIGLPKNARLSLVDVDCGGGWECVGSGSIWELCAFCPVLLETYNCSKNIKLHVVPAVVQQVKDLVLPQLWHKSQLWLRFTLWPRNFPMPRVLLERKREREKERKKRKYYCSNIRFERI